MQEVTLVSSCHNYSEGFCKNIESESEINSKLLAESFQAGVETAYKAVMKPVEGTILTVAKDAAQAAVEKSK